MQLKVYIIFFFICTFLSKIIFRVSFRRLEKRLINNSTRMRRCTGAKKKGKKEDDSFGISAAICRRIYPLWSGHGGPRPPWRIYALYLLICLTAVTGRTLCLPFQGSEIFSILFAHYFREHHFLPLSSGSHRVAQTMLVNARRRALCLALF